MESAAAPATANVAKVARHPGRQPAAISPAISNTKTAPTYWYREAVGSRPKPKLPAVVNQNVIPTARATRIQRRVGVRLHSTQMLAATSATSRGRPQPSAPVPESSRGAPKPNREAMLLAKPSSTYGGLVARLCADTLLGTFE